MTTQEMPITQEARQVSWLDRINVLYGLLILAVLMQFGAPSAWKSFIAGWLIAVLNLELIKRLGMMLLSVSNGGKLHPIFYFFLVGKFIFWGLVIALFSTVSWIQAIPFVFGTTTLVISGLGLGMKELVYAR